MAADYRLTGDYPSGNSERKADGSRWTEWKRMHVARYETREQAEQMLQRLESMPTTIGRDFRVEGPEDETATAGGAPAADGGGGQTAAFAEPA